MNINSIIHTERPTITSLVSSFRDEQLFVDDTFQRKLVWIEKQKVRLIETILLGYPMPELYLWQQPANPETGVQRRSIVDGQQRITTMFQFISNEWKLKSSYLDPRSRNQPFADCFWRDLSDESKKSFWDYIVNVRIIPSTISREQIVTVFTRLNETDRSLNPQEVRNAEFNGLLIAAAEEIADLDFWENWKVFSPNQIRRMKDIEFTSSLLIYLRRGPFEENTETVNQMYDLYNDKYDERKSDLRVIGNFLRLVDDIFRADQDVCQLFAKPVHLFTLFCVYVHLRDQKRTKLITKELLAEFSNAYKSPEGSGDRHIEDYRKGSASRTRSKLSRDLRFVSFLNWADEAWKNE